MPMHETKREHVCAKDAKCARPVLPRFSNQARQFDAEEENGIIVDANFSTPSPSKKSLAVLGDCARPGASLTAANAIELSSSAVTLNTRRGKGDGSLRQGLSSGRRVGILDLVAAEEGPDIVRLKRTGGLAR